MINLHGGVTWHAEGVLFGSDGRLVAVGFVVVVFFTGAARTRIVRRHFFAFAWWT